jgi:hypothetical protein
MVENSNGQYPPCYVCAQDVKKAHGMVGAEGPMCSRECARAYFIGRQIAGMRGVLVAYLQAQQSGQVRGLVLPP